MDDRQFNAHILDAERHKNGTSILSQGVPRFGTNKAKAVKLLDGQLKSMKKATEGAEQKVKLLSLSVRRAHGASIVSEATVMERNAKIMEQFKPLWHQPSQSQRRKVPVSACAPDPINRLQDLAKHLEELKIFKNKKVLKDIKLYEDQEAQTILDIFQLMLYYVPGMSRFLRRNLISIILEISKRTKLFPAPFFIEGLDFALKFKADGATSHGAYGNIYQGIYQENVVCLKVLRYKNDDKVLAREVAAWGQVSHPNLLPFYGIGNHDNQICLVSPWARKGTILEFLEAEEGRQSLTLDATRLRLCSDVVSGLKYLHEHDIIHGDLKGTNILIDKSHRAYLADFGLASVVYEDLVLTQKYSSLGGGTPGYRAPEILMSTNNSASIFNTKESDIFSLSMIFAGREVQTSDIPSPQEFNNELRELELAYPSQASSLINLRIMVGLRPELNQIDVTDDLRQLMSECWAQNPTDRPDISTIEERLIPMLPVGDDHRPIGEWQEKPVEVMAPIQGRVRAGEVPLTLKGLDMMNRILREIGTGEKPRHSGDVEMGV
ncbi:hypothetical protein H0H92_013508 [Tricholoma furcatifolium]|nr:hypothetical protein H0H92_013508 [Tricholoma furcatifolium]